MDIKINNNGTIEHYVINKYATLCDISLMQKINGSMALCTICIDYNDESNEGFLPLTIQYIERFYAIGKIPQGFQKREGKPSEHEILISRLIDRSLRPLVKNDFTFNTQITIMVLSYDGKSDLAKDCLNLASIAMQLSSIPLKNKNFITASRIAKINNKPLICNNICDLQESSLDLLISGYNNSICMIDLEVLKNNNVQKLQEKNNMAENAQESANEIDEKEFLALSKLALKNIKTLSKLYKDNFAQFANKKIEIKTNKLDSKILDALHIKFGKRLDSLIKIMSKSENLNIANDLLDDIGAFLESKNVQDKDIAKKYLFYLQKEKLRQNALMSKRADGRKIDEIRNIHIESNILPHAHGSAVFTRGQTQALVSCSIGSQNDAQMIESLQSSKKKKVIFHYNFLPFSVNDASSIGAPNRRELGHANLALKAINSNINDDNVLRIVSDILQSNGSSSMASVCGASLAIIGANIKMKNYVAGVALGLVYESDKNFVILSDIVGIEDFCGDMDFKICGSHLGFSAMQLDIKIDGINLDILQASLKRARENLDSILNIMQKSHIKPNLDILPQKETFNIESNKASLIIGQGGRTIKDITQKFNVSIDIKNNEVSIMSNNKSNILKAKDYIFTHIFKIQSINCNVNDVFSAVVKKVLDYGVIVEFNGLSGLIHKTKMTRELQFGDNVEVKVANINNNKIDLEINEDFRDNDLPTLKSHNKTAKILNKNNENETLTKQDSKTNNKINKAKIQTKLESAVELNTKESSLKASSIKEANTKKSLNKKDTKSDIKNDNAKDIIKDNAKKTIAQKSNAKNAKIAKTDSGALKTTHSSAQGSSAKISNNKKSNDKVSSKKNTDITPTKRAPTKSTKAKNEKSKVTKLSNKAKDLDAQKVSQNKIAKAKNVSAKNTKTKKDEK